MMILSFLLGSIGLLSELEKRTSFFKLMSHHASVIYDLIRDHTIKVETFIKYIMRQEHLANERGLVHSPEKKVVCHNKN